MIDLLIPSFLGEQCEQIAQVAHQKWAMWANHSGRSLTKNERCEQIAQVAHQKWANERIAFFKEQITHLFIFSHKKGDSLRKTDELIPSPEKNCVNLLLSKLQWDEWS